MAPVFSFAVASVFLPPVLCIILFFLLLLNDVLTAQVYDRETLLLIRSLMVDHNIPPHWADTPHTLLSTSVHSAGLSDQNSQRQRRKRGEGPGFRWSRDSLGSEVSSENYVDCFRWAQPRYIRPICGMSFPSLPLTMSDSPISVPSFRICLWRPVSRR